MQLNIRATAVPIVNHGVAFDSLKQEFMLQNLSWVMSSFWW